VHNAFDASSIHYLGKRLGHGNLEFFGPQMALAYRLDAISQGPKYSRRGKVFFQSLLFKNNFEPAFQKDNFSATFTAIVVCL
jgi:hypothetical protein